MRGNGGTNVASLESARGLAMMTGYGDHRFKKPQGLNQTETTAEESCHLWVTGKQPPKTDTDACMYVYMCI